MGEASRNVHAYYDKTFEGLLHIGASDPGDIEAEVESAVLHRERVNIYCSFPMIGGDTDTPVAVVEWRIDYRHPLQRRHVNRSDSY